MELVLQLVAVVLASARVTNLLVDDLILEPWRGRLRARLDDRPMLRDAIGCHFCVGFWVSCAWAGAWALWPNTTAWAALPWAVAQASWWADGAWLYRDSEDD